MNQKQLLFFSFCLLLLLIFRFIFVFKYENKPKLFQGDLVTFKTKITQEPKTSSGYQFFKAETGGREIDILVLAYPQYHYADRVKISGKLSIRKEISKQNFQLLNSNLNQSFILYFPKIEKVKESDNQILSFISFIRQRLINNFSKILSPFGSSLLLGIVFGIKDAMPKESLAQLKTTGVMHVIAASGMNVTMVAGFLTSLTVLFFKRKNALVISIIGIFFYAALAGFEPSIVRAAIMGTLVFSAQILGRQTIAGYCLFLTAFLMLFLNPRQISDIGFQLSFLSTAGILYIQPLFSRFTAFRKSVVGESIITTICAQLTTLPLMLLYFGNYSPWSVVVNALVLWTIPPLMLLGGVAGIFSFIFIPLTKVMLYLCLPFLVYFEKTTAFFAKLPGLMVNVNFPPLFVVGYYLILLSFILYLRKKEAISKD